MDEVAAITARPTSEVPSLAAIIGSAPSSTWRKMFSSTTIVSSMTMPTARDMANMVMLFTVKFSA